MLEIGCGWGGFAIHAAREHGCRVTGTHDLARRRPRSPVERVAEAGLADRVEIVERDYRLVEGSFSRIASIEMFEAIGLAEHETFFRAVDRLLAPDGIAVLQTIGIPDERFERYRRTPDWIQQYIFPGSLLPSRRGDRARRRDDAPHGRRRSRRSASATRGRCASGARTSGSNVDAVRALGYDERFLRIWTYYLSYCEAAFAIRSLRDVQLVLSRSFNDALPAHPSVRPTY